MDSNDGVLEEMLKGYGEGFSEEELFGITPSEDDVRELESVIPTMGRYLNSVAFMKDVTSGKAVSLKRFHVIAEYFISLSKLLSDYRGPYAKVVGRLSADDILAIRKIGTTLAEIKQAEYIEKFTDHDTAAAADLVKIMIGRELPHLKEYIEGVHFACTSEDVMGNVFGLVANELVFVHFMTALRYFVKDLVDYADKHEENGPLILPALTHEQAAEPTTLGKKFMTRTQAINYLVRYGFYKDETQNCFSGKLGGAVGNLTCHYAAYPDIDWWVFARKFVEDAGLHYEEMTDQCVSYVVEAQLFSTVANILTQIIKLTKDFVNMASCPSQFFVKKKRAGQKGSSIMPNKSNAWGMEGAIGMLEEARAKLIFLATSLPDYPHEGNMKRSYLFRNIGDAFMPIFIALKRITKEMRSYHPNHAKIEAFFREYPGMAGSSLQTVLKRQGVSGDAYRIIQGISINDDGSYANSEQFKYGLETNMSLLGLSVESRDELRKLLDPSNLVGPVHEKVKMLMDSIKKYQ